MSARVLPAAPWLRRVRAVLTPAQHDLRRQGIAASDIAAILGISPWATPIDVYCQKTGLVDPGEETPPMRRGRMMEPAIAAFYAEITQREVAMPAVVWPDSIDGTVRHPTIPWALATPDRVVLDSAGRPERLVEIKSVSWKGASEWGGDPDSVPDIYRVQTEWQMEVCGIGECDLVPWIAGEDEPRIYPLRRDEGLAALLVKAAAAFWQRVERREAPCVDGSPGWRTYLDRRYPADEERTLSATPVVNGWAEAYERASEIKRLAEREMLAAEAEIKLFLGEAATVRGEGWHASWRKAKSGGTDWKQVAVESGATPEIIARHARPGTRRFVFTAEEE